MIYYNWLQFIDHVGENIGIIHLVGLDWRAARRKGNNLTLFPLIYQSHQFVLVA